MIRYAYLIGLFLPFVFFSSACENKRKDIMAIQKPGLIASQSGKGITMLYTDSAILKVKVIAPEMYTYDKNVAEPFTLLPKGVYVVFYDNAGKQTSTLKANYGVRYERSKKMEAKYNVEVVNINGEKLNTEHLIWDEARKKIISDTFVKITTDKEIIMGNGLEANQDFTQYEIKQITGTIKVEDQATEPK